VVPSEVPPSGEPSKAAVAAGEAAVAEMAAAVAPAVAVAVAAAVAVGGTGCSQPGALVGTTCRPIPSTSPARPTRRSLQSRQ
jgi:hypothetical protein